MLKVSQVAKEMNVSRETIVTWCKDGTIKGAVKIKRLWFIPEKEFERIKKGGK